MEPKDPGKPKLPSEAVELYNLFIHGVISRRAFLDGIQKFAIGGLAAGSGRKGCCAPEWRTLQMRSLTCPVQGMLWVVRHRNTNVNKRISI